MRKLQRSGYSWPVREMIVTAGVKGYLRMVRDEADGGRRVNRARQDGEAGRRYKRPAGKGTWFKKEKLTWKGPARGEQITTKKDTLMFVPPTPGDVLAKRLQEAENIFVENRPGGKVKMVPRGGLAIRNPWNVEGCKKTNCFVCSSISWYRKRFVHGQWCRVRVLL